MQSPAVLLYELGYTLPSGIVQLEKYPIHPPSDHGTFAEVRLLELSSALAASWRPATRKSHEDTWIV